MTKKLLIGVLMMVVILLELPLAASASTTGKNAAMNAGRSKPQISIQVGNRRRRHRRYYRTYSGYRNYGEYRRYTHMDRKYALVPQYYWRNGRRHVRYVRTNNGYNY
jgi:hypothetical protein